MTQAVTVKRRAYEDLGVRVYFELDITSYTTGGEALTATELELGSVEWETMSQLAPKEGQSHKAAFILSSKKVKVFSTGTTEATATTDLGTFAGSVIGHP